MYLSIYTESPELADCREAAEAEILEWLKDFPARCEAVQEDERLGSRLEVKKNSQLKNPLNFFYGVAKFHKLEFVIAMQDEDSGDWEEVCFFGYEEGRPDIFEVACYLGL